jgi:hypothetical protein
MDKRVVLLLAVLSAPLSAQEFPDAPSTHRFWDSTNQGLILSHAALEAVDAGITHRNLSRGGKEINEMAKPLCESGSAGQVICFAGRSVGVVGISYLLHGTHHHKLERLFIIAASIDSAYGVAYSFAHR